MARVTSILEAGLASASRGPVEVTVPTNSQRDAVKQRATSRASVSTAGLPNDLVPTVAAGAGMGAVFGPVGALLGAGLAHHFSAKRREGIAAYALAQEQNAAEVFESSRNALNRMYGLATTDGERAEINLRQDELDGLEALAGSPDMKTALGALVKAQELSGTLDDQYDDWEAERIAAEKVVIDETTRYQNQAVAMRNRLASESGTYIDASTQWENLKQLLSADDISKVDGTTAIFTFAKLVNPGEITTDGDVQVLSAGGGLSSQLAARLNSVLLGNAYMDDTIAAEMIEAGKKLMTTQREQQVGRNMEAQKFASDLGIPEAIRRNISIPINASAGDLVPQPLPAQPPGEGASVGPIGQFFRDAAGLMTPAGGLESPEALIDQAGREVKDWMFGSGAEARRERWQNRRPTND